MAQEAPLRPAVAAAGAPATVLAAAAATAPATPTAIATATTATTTTAATATSMAMAPAAAPAPATVAITSLPQALAIAYERSPELMAARAQLRATDEGVAIVRAQGLPSLQGAAEFNHLLDPGRNNLTAPENTLTATVSATVPVYMGGAIRNGISAARQRVISGRHDLDSVEANIFTRVVAAYLGVIHDEAVVSLNQRNVGALGINLMATDARFQKGDLTRTDVAQSNQRFEQARAQLIEAQVALAASREAYVRLVGVAPGVLAAPPPLTGLPASAQEAIEIAMRANPDLLAAEARSRAAHLDTRAADGQRLPRVSGVASYQYNNYFNSLGGPYAAACSSAGSCFQQDRSAAIGAQVVIPIYQGGGPAAQVRAAQAREGQALEQTNAVSRAVIETTRSAFYAWQASGAVIAASEAAVASAEQSLTGVRAENRIGTRTIIDVLNAEQEMLNTQVQLVSARRNAYVAGFNLLAAMGQAKARDLGIDPARLYNAAEHYRRVGGSIWDWGSDPDPVAGSSPTTEVPAQDGLLR